MERNKTIRITALLAGLLCIFTTSAQDKQNTIQPLPKEVEIRLALSALPPHLRDSATVYVLDPAKGFEIARKGSNGFHTFVARNGDDAMRGDWPLIEYRNDILYPISFDEAGAKTIMPVFFDIAKMQAKGTPPAELKKTIQDRFKKKYYKAPQRAGISYMLSPILRTYTNPDANDNVITASVPHVMYYAPNITNDEVGGSKPAPGAKYPFVILPGPHGYSIQFLGQAETEAVRKEYKSLLEQLCTINKEWCLPATEDRSAATHQHH
ncbi:hypothetical protein [Paraflavitalea sp. CAU 1676]|uniref:hypothetical protein n=1 Tax=Paraflavitalea sp. CAU 1676 TaxID=3032598 RepID=UPI0023DAB0F7|nr:hypothetical protein [Paraflavitalea sp. CAU 1676]MDF2191238.1 hypothetical protein [Paraflavitalea sp. CAU 1676]